MDRFLGGDGGLFGGSSSDEDDGRKKINNRQRGKAHFDPNINGETGATSELTQGELLSQNQVL